MSAPRLKEKYFQKVIPALKEKWGFSSDFEVPFLEKIVISVGAGKAVGNPAFLDEIMENLLMITGQKPSKTYARKSIAGFKLRAGMAIGVRVTLRKDKMYEFLDRFISIVLPRLRDFRGVKSRFDGRGNLSMGIPEQVVFPEVNLEKMKNIHGLQITLVTSTNNEEKAKDLLYLLGVPFEKEEK